MEHAGRRTCSTDLEICPPPLSWKYPPSPSLEFDFFSNCAYNTGHFFDFFGLMKCLNHICEPQMQKFPAFCVSNKKKKKPRKTGVLKCLTCKCQPLMRICASNNYKKGKNLGNGGTEVSHLYVSQPKMPKIPAIVLQTRRKKNLGKRGY